jgi:hypothetical protein
MDVAFSSRTRYIFLFVSRYPSLIGGCVYIQSSFGLNHGKRLHDKVDVILKRFIRQVQLDVERPQLQNLEQVVNLLWNCLSTQQKKSYSWAKRLVTWTFWHVKLANVDQIAKYITNLFKWTRDLHYV